MEGRHRKDIAPGMMVEIIRKKDQLTGTLTRGRVKRILTNSDYHPHGIKYADNDVVGRVKNIL